MAHFLSQNWLLNRRHVLRGLGVTLALPLLNCMRPLRAADSAGRPRRSVFIYLPNGVNTQAYQMPTSGPEWVVSTLIERYVPSPSMTTSVKVPPTSAPIRIVTSAILQPANAR